MIRLLAHVLQLNPQVPHHEDILDGILLDAWHALTSASNVLTLDANGYTLHLEGMAFLPMAEAWQCPVTRRFLDTTLRGVTPYLPRTASPARAQCQRISLPLYDIPFGGTPDDIVRVHRGRDWLAAQDSLTPLREEGFWGDLNDRVIELPPYFTAAEHSAQQTSGRLKVYEDDFKRGDLNLLSCSTTMEMGIDIGGISIVAMNNVPPNPANYLQRAGRAGRRREPRSLSMTLCKSNPHDQTVFSNTRWPFDSLLPAPRVSLDSPVIVQRHIHSLLLAAFMQEVLMGSGQEQTRLTCGMFFLNDASLAARFADWSRQLPRPDQQPVVDGVRMLQRKTCLESRPIDAIALDAARSIEAIAGAWRLEHGNLSAELARLIAGGRESPASRAVTLQLTRMEDEYLLRELATRGFLPVYGFPTHIASFDNYTRGQFLRERRQREQGRREDNVSQRRELASRDLQTALREYAPGAEVVMDGLVFRSSGVTLNWHIPAAQTDVREIQEFRWAWRCSKCGASGSTLSFDSAGHCTECGEKIKDQDRNEFLVPAGFAVDFHKEPNNDINSQHFVPVERPWVNAHGDWHPLFNGRGRYRMCTDGHILFHSRGINGTGYALCLSCGRAEPMTPGDPPGNPIGGIPSVFQTQHNKLRCSDDHQGICEGSHNEWMIKRGTLLGHETLSDMLEIQLQNEAGLWMNDKTVAQTLAVALRDELAEMIGVQASELGCDFKPALTPDHSACCSILIYDRYAAGYSSGLQDGDLATLFENARRRLDCPARCDSVCPHCVLDFDQRFNAEALDRYTALTFLSEPWFV
ncbi:helicase-related protein [Thauera sp. SDU_THAU2]|uniref:helicase-related protein n=1 Tax=Thauera sp. SDU_THAU2 TaxID=3136633 RepID=UPI00311D7B8E